MKNWNTSLVTKMVGYVWYDRLTADFIGFGSKSSFNGDISGWDTSQVTTMESMFMEASAFNQNIGEWDTSQVINRSRCFARHPRSTKIFLVAWTKMVGYVWYDDYTADFIGFGSKSSFNGDISGWDTSQVTTMESMFMEASGFNQNIGEWDTSQVINMEQMFYRASAFNQDISGWTGTAATTSQVNIFFDATAFLLKFTCFETSQCLLEDKFNGLCTTYGLTTTKYGTMPDWDVSRVTKMVGYVWYDDYTADFIGFGSKSSFNGDISGWDTPQVTTMESMFMEASAFNQNIGEWDTSQVINMEQMFYRASAFNQDISWVDGYCSDDEPSQHIFRRHCVSVEIYVL
ncbi:unnamed protein product [Bathycoccus prasinos]